ncbi:major facilitator superfamily transporter [Colletotrichum scovillei]|uniref:Major facilitator superfamily transporter n=1 Tax=Colletotrichum scovillei TaxID=1209932 RepID=A0A9P7QZ84_9PEZI|nr:major facilitator superfamily transporter [Colletotrichum scovillei]
MPPPRFHEILNNPNRRVTTATDPPTGIIPTTIRRHDVEWNASSPPQLESASILSSIFAPQLRHLASHPSLHGSISSSEPRGMGQQGLTPVTEQRHPGKTDARISRFARQFEPGIDEVDGGDYQRQVTYLDMARAEKHGSVVSPSSGSEVEGEQGVEGWRLAVLVIGICLAVFSISADRSLLTTAIPQITSELQSTADIGWYGSAQLLTICAFQPVFGRVFMLFSVKWAYVLATFLFLAGSLTCGLAPGSLALIGGRAVAGFGSAGVLTGSFVVIATAVPVRVRPVCTAIVGLIFGLGAMVGPLLGGVFTGLVTWRWCFYINLPIAGFTLIVFLLFFHPRQQPQHKKTFLNKIFDLDLIGNVLLLGACVMLFLALQYITQGEPLSSTRIIGLLSGAGATAIVFAAWQWWKQDGALFTPAIITQRTVAASCVAAFATYGALLIHIYFLPIWFQAVRGESALSSGVDMLPYVAAIALFSLLAGIFVSIVGHPPAPAIIGGMIATAGCGKLLTLSPDTPTPHWIGFEILVAAGFGMAIQQGFTAVQAVLPPDEVPVGTAAVVASQALGGAVFVSIGNALFQNHLLRASAPGVDIPAVLGAGVTAFRTVVPAETLPIMVSVYNDALRVVLTAAIPLAAVSAIAACFMEWKSLVERDLQVFAADHTYGALLRNSLGSPYTLEVNDNWAERVLYCGHFQEARNPSSQARVRRDSFKASKAGQGCESLDPQNQSPSAYCDKEEITGGVPGRHCGVALCGDKKFACQNSGNCANYTFGVPAGQMLLNEYLKSDLGDLATTTVTATAAVAGQSTGAAATCSATAAESSFSNGISTGAAAGIGVGIGAPLALAIAALTVMLLREKRKTRAALSSQVDSSGTGPSSPWAKSERTAYVPVEMHGQPVPNEMSSNHDRRHELS